MDTERDGSDEITPVPESAEAYEAPHIEDVGDGQTQLAALAGIAASHGPRP
jgi:hypothetical protein